MNLNYTTLEKIMNDIIKRYRNECLENRLWPTIYTFLESFGFDSMDYHDFYSQKDTVNNYMALKEIDDKKKLKNLILAFYSRCNYVSFFSKDKINNKEFVKEIRNLNFFLQSDGYLIVQSGMNIELIKIDKTIRYNDFCFYEGEYLENYEKVLETIKKLKIDKKLMNLIIIRFKEITLSISANNPLSTLFLCGSVLEGVLIGIAINNKGKFYSSPSSPKCDKFGKMTPKDIEDWSLNELITVSIKIGMIKEDLNLNLNSLRNFKNYIHPYEQLRSNLHPDIETAKLTIKVLETVIFQISNYINS